MSDKQPIEILSDMLAPQYEDGSAHVIEKSRAFFDDADPAAAAEAFIQRYQADVEKIAKDIAAHWGKPSFAGAPTGNSDVAWAYWRGIVSMAAWKHGDLYAFVAVEHQDQELPVVLLLGVSDGKDGDDDAVEDGSVIKRFKLPGS